MEGLPEAEVLEEEEELVITGHRVHIQTKCHHEELLEVLEGKLPCLGGLVEENLEDSDVGPLEDSWQGWTWEPRNGSPTAIPLSNARVRSCAGFWRWI